MKCVVLAAGQGSRLQPYNAGRPKCMLPVLGATLLDHTIAAVRHAGIQDVVVVRSHPADYFGDRDVRFAVADAGLNMVHSLFCADAELDGPVLIVYGDIVYEQRVLDALLACPHEISVAIDTDWAAYFTARTGNAYEIAESLDLRTDRIVGIGMPLDPSAPLPAGQYMGLIKLGPRGVGLVRQRYWELRREFWGRPWRQASYFQLAFMTDLLQELADSGVEVHATPVQRGWLEFDTARDYELFRTWCEEGSLSQFLKPSGLALRDLAARVVAPSICVSAGGAQEKSVDVP